MPIILEIVDDFSFLFGSSLAVLEPELVLFESDDGDDDLMQVVQMVNLQNSCLQQKFAKVDQKQ